MKLFIFACALTLACSTEAQNPWGARVYYTSTDFQSQFHILVRQGYRLNYVSGFSINNNSAFSAIWEYRASPAWVARIEQTSAQYQQSTDTYVSQGYRPVIVNGYPFNDVDYYAAIWEKSPSEAWVARHGMTSSAYQAEFNNWVGQGYRLKHVSGYSANGGALYAAIWEKTNDSIPWVTRHNLTSSDYQAEFNSYVSQGYRLVHVSGYQVKGVDYFAAIWDKSPSGPWNARHDMTATMFTIDGQNWIRQGYMLKLLCGYNLGLWDLYAALWVKAEDDVLQFTPAMPLSKMIRGPRA